MKWYLKEDIWAIVIGCFIVFAISILWFYNLNFIYKTLSVKFLSWSDFEISSSFKNYNFLNLLLLYMFLGGIFGISALFLKYNFFHFILTFTILFILSIFVFIFSSHSFIKNLQLDAPLIALVLGLTIRNFFALPIWFKNSLTTEFYVKTGIVIMGGSIPLMLLFNAGIVAILQACIITFVTFFTILFFANKVFKLDPSFGATLAGGGSICGVSAAIVIGNSCKAKQEYISASISIVIFWAVIMVIVLPFLCKVLNLDSGVAGAWIGTSEFADAAGMAAAASLGDDRAITAFTIIKVLGRDMFIGVWAVFVAFLSITRWNKQENQKISIKIIWDKFPKFVLGFVGLCLLIAVFTMFLNENEFKLFQKEALNSVKVFRDWIFILTFLCIGLSTSFKAILSVGYKPFLAFSIGVAVNLPLGFLLSNYVFVDFWTNFLVEGH